MNQRCWKTAVLLIGVGFLGEMVLAAEPLQPVSMSAEEFSRLSVADQRALLVRVFERRREHARNLHYEMVRFRRCREYHDGKIGKPREAGARSQYRHWRLGDSYRMDINKYKSPEDAEFLSWTSSGFDAQEGRARSTLEMSGDKRAYGRIDSVHNKIVKANRYLYWLDGEFPQKEEYLFRYLLDHQDEFEIKAPVEQEKVQLAVSWQPWWAEKPGGKRVFILDPRKGFLPLRGDSRWDDLPENGEPEWRVEEFVVEESRLVGDVWMPTKLTERIAASPVPNNIAVYEMEILRIEYGKVTPADLVVPFTEGTEVVDAIKGVTYKVGADGLPKGLVEPVFDAAPFQDKGRVADGGWTFRRNMLWFTVGVMILVGAFLIRKQMSKRK